MIRFYLVRHGETEYNQKGCYYGWTDCGLSERGILQAEKLKEAFERIHIDQVICSDLKRAAETARRMLPIEPLRDARLRELNFGHWEGLNYREIMEKYPTDWKAWTEDWIKGAPTEGESFLCMWERITACMEEGLEKYKDKSIAIVAHNGSLRIIASYLLGMAPEKQWCFDFEQGKYSLLEWQEGQCVIRNVNFI
jgi:alpha-ribazole phosphatase